MTVRKGGYGLLEWETGSGDTLKIRVRILDARQNYGRTDFLVEPVAGSGEAWVQEAKLESET